jgi:hypothetical protein
MFSIIFIMTGGYIEEVPLHGLLARQISIFWTLTGWDT